MRTRIVSGTMITLLLIFMLSALKFSSGHVPTMDYPIFELLSMHSTPQVAGIDMEFTFNNTGYPATTGTVWVPWEKVSYDTPLVDDPPSGNINETLLELDVNGDDDKLDVFTVRYVNDIQAEVDSEIANAMRIPEQTFEYPWGRLDVMEKNSFTIGAKTHALYAVRNTYAGFALDNFFHDHPSPNIEIVISQMVTSPRNASTAEVTSLKLNGDRVSYEFNWTNHEFNAETGQWRADNAYVYPLGFIDTNEVFTVELSIRGEPSSYKLYVILNWASDTLHRYRYLIDALLEIPFTIPAAPVILTIQSTFKASGSGTAFAASISIFDQWDYNDVRLGINTDPPIGGFWLRFAKDGVITDFNLGIADAQYHTYKIEYDGTIVKIYIDNILKKTLSVVLTDIKIALHANARAIGDTVSAQFDGITLSNTITFADDFNDGIIDPIWTIQKADWMSITEQAGFLDMSGTATQQFWINGGTALLKISDLRIQATIDIDPDTLNLMSKGRWIAAYIELPEGYDVAGIDASTILLNDAIPAESRPIAIGDYDSDGIPDLVLKFDRAEVIEYILNSGITDKFMRVTLTITGKLNDGTPFQGSNTIRVIYIEPKYDRYIQSIDQPTSL